MLEILKILSDMKIVGGDEIIHSFFQLKNKRESNETHRITSFFFKTSERQ